MAQQTGEAVAVAPQDAAGAAAHPAAPPAAAKLVLEGKEHELPVVIGSEGEKAIDITKLRATTGYITLDPGYGNTGACESAITFIDGEAGILRYRGYPIEEIAGRTNFVDVCYLLIYCHLPNPAEIKQFRQNLTYHSLLHEDMKKFFEGFPAGAHPMAILSAMVASLSAYYPERQEDIDLNITPLRRKGRPPPAFPHKK